MREWNRVKRIIKGLSPVWDLVSAPLVVPASLLLKAVRSYGVGRLPIVRRVFWRLGVLPVTDHYYEPFFRRRDLRRSLDRDRDLPGLDLNPEGQLALLKQFRYDGELASFPRQGRGYREYYYGNEAFLSGDAEFLYCMIRHFRPKRIIEVGSGFSTLMALNAVEANRREDGGYSCDIVCVEPYEHSWLKDLPVTLVRERVEWTDPGIYGELEENDILFIDSSHVLRPQGDLVFTYLEILPSLREGVLVHIHDIFTPRDYPEEWIVREIRLWNEQYVLEAFLSNNESFEVVAALNYLRHRYPEALCAACPVLAEELADREPGSFWMRKVR